MTVTRRYDARGDFEDYGQVAGSTTQYRPSRTSSRYLEKQPDGSWVLVDQDGPDELYASTGRLTGLRDDADPSRSLTFTYDAEGRLATATSGTGRALRFTYQDGYYTDPPNALGWRDARLTRIEDDAGQALATYGYSGAGLLASVTYAGGVSRSYVYGESDHLCVGATGPCTPALFAGYVTGIVDESGARVSDYYFDPYGRATRSVHAGGANETILTYVSNTQTTVTRPGEPTLTYTFESALHRRPLAVQSSAGTETTQYDPAGAWQTVTDRRGIVTRTEYDSYRRVSRVIEAQGLPEQRSAVITRPSATTKIIEKRNAAGAALQRMTYVYNARNQVQTMEVADLVTVPNATRTTTYAYCEQAEVTAGTCPIVGLLKSVDGPQLAPTLDVTTYTYRQVDEPTCATAPATCPYRKGDLWKVTNAAGHVFEISSYDRAGRALRTIDPNGVVTDLEYDPRGRVTARKLRGANAAAETDDQITRLEYWPTGQLKKVTEPDGAFTSYAYDAAHRLVGISDNAGNSLAYTLNAAGARTREDTKDPANTLRRTLSRTFNALGQLQVVTDAYGRTTSFTYDVGGNLDTTTDALGRVTDQNVDALGRLSRTLQDASGIAAETKFGYDALDNLTQVKDPKLLDTNYTYNGFRETKTLASPDTGTTTYDYDSGGNRISQTDARGKVTSYAYDAVDRLIGVSYPAAPTLNTTYVYDAAQADCLSGETFGTGRLTRLTDGSGSTVYCYDRFGQLVRKKQTTNGVAYTIRYGYGADGRLLTIVRPDSSETRYGYDAQGRVTEITVRTAAGAEVPLLSGATYAPFGPVQQWTYGNGRVAQRTFDLNYRPYAVQGDAGGLSLGYEFDEVGNLKKLRAAAQADPPQRVYGYDSLNRLTESRNGATNALLQGYAYDKTGNRTSATLGATTTAYTYPAGSHRLSQIGATAARTYDANGNTTQIPGATAKSFVYGDHNRMTQVLDGATVAMNYAYNGKGELVRKFLGAASTYSLYDEAGHWLADYSNATTPVQQAIWLGDLPVGVLVGAGASQKLYYLEPDALGTPRVVVDPTRGTNGVAVWTWDLGGEAFGATAPNQDPDGDATSFVLDLRFPGQRFDSASGLSYNYFRDYEPGTGRYSQSDPIGLGGGVSTYAYGANKPLVSSDPLGLKPLCRIAKKPVYDYDIVAQKIVLLGYIDDLVCEDVPDGPCLDCEAIRRSCLETIPVGMGMTAVAVGAFGAAARLATYTSTAAGLSGLSFRGFLIRKCEQAFQGCRIQNQQRNCCS